MKLFLSTFLTSVAFTQGRNLETGDELQQKWNLENPTTEYTAETNKFTMVYGMVSDSLTAAANMQVVFYDENCKDPIADPTTTITPDQYQLTVGKGVTAVADETILPVPEDLLAVGAGAQLEFLLDTQTLANDVKIYEVVTEAMITAGDYLAEDLSKGVMKLCARYSLGYYTIGTNFQEVNFLESLLTVKYDLTAGFTVDAFAVAPKIRDEATGVKDSYAVVAFMCIPETDNTDTALAYPNVNGIETLNQGALVQVCVRPDDLTRADGVVLASLTDFEWTRGEIAQPVITEGVLSTNGLSSVTCVSQSEYCHFSSILFADFYQSAGNVVGGGNANLEFKTLRSRRNLKGGEEGRRQLQDAAATSPFDLSVGVSEGDEGPGALKTAGGASVGFTALASAVSLIIVALLA